MVEIGNSEAKRQSQVTEQLRSLMKEEEMLGEVISKLTIRLEPALRELPIKEEERAKDSRPVEPLVPVANAIRELRIKVSNQTQRISALISRIEV